MSNDTTLNQNEPQLKRCSTCEIEKPVSDFVKDKNRKDGFAYECKQCRKAYRQSHKEQESERHARYYREHKDDHAKKMFIWRQTRLKEESEYSARYYREHQKERAEYATVWRRENPDKARLGCHHYRARKRDAEGSHTAKEVQALYDSQNGRCAYCDCNLTETKKHLDHIVPLKRGGSNWVANLAWACRHCNTSKGDKLLSEWEH